MTLISLPAKKTNKILALTLLTAFVFSLFDLRVFSEGSISATLKTSESTVHSGANYTLSVELSAAYATDIKAEISRGSDIVYVDIPAGQKGGSVEVKAGSYGKTTEECYTLQKNSAFDASGNAEAKVKVLPKPSISFNANFLMTSVGRNLKVYFKCKNADQISVALPISLRNNDGTILEKYTIDTSHSSFQHTVKIEKNWKFPYTLTVYNELTGTKCASIPVMVTDASKPGIRRVDTTEKKIALGFDCGYNNVYTDYILDTLDEYDAKVTFFVTGFFCKGFPDQLKKIKERGHEIGNHTMNHLRMNELSTEEVYSEIKGVNDMVHDIVGISPKIMRPSYGAGNSRVVAISRMLGCETVFWTEDSYDWDPEKTADYIINRSTKNMGEGCILLFHNSAPKTKKTLKKILDDYKAKGLKVVPISELLYDGNYTIDAKGLQKPDPSLKKITAAELLSGRKFTVNVTGASAEQTELELSPLFNEEPVWKNKKDVEKIQSNPSLMTVSYDFGDTVNAPIQSGDTLGKATFSYNNEVWFTAEMTAAHDIALPDVSSDISPTDTKASDIDPPSPSKGYGTPFILGANVAILAIAVLTFLLIKSVRKLSGK